MASEIRVNSLSSRTGLSTVTFTDTGPIFSGITTFQDNSGFNGRLKVGTTNDIIWNQTSEDGVVIEQSGATQIVRNGDVPLLVTRNTSTGQIVKFSQAGTERGSILYDGDFGIASAGNLTFDIGGTERVRISSGGSVGIGTNNPGERLHLTTTSGNCKLRIDAASAASVDFYNSGTRFSDMFTDASTGNFTITNRQNADIILRTNGTNERVYIKSSGEVGLGLNPTAGDGALQIAGGLRVAGSASASDTNSPYIYRTSGYDHLNFATSGVERLRILSSGQLLLGTTDAGINSGDNLTIADSGHCGLTIRSGTSSQGNIFFSDGTSGNSEYDGFIQYQQDTQSMLFGTGGGTERLRIGSGGNLALGGQNTSAYSGHSNFFLGGIANLYAETTAASTGSLSVSNNAYINSSGNWVYRVNGKASNSYQYDGGYGFRTAGTGSAGGTISWTERLTVDSSGRVTKPTQPGFFARRSNAGDGRAAQAQEWTIAGTGSFNTGNHFNASNGRFTAPVAGRYIFTAAPGYKQTSYDYNFKFLINGGQQSEPVRVIDGGDDLTSHSGFTGTVIYNLNANDYVQVEVGYIHHVNLTYNFFMGYLLG